MIVWPVWLVAAALAGAFQSPERVAEISVHGNTLTPDAEVIRLADVTVGMPFDDRLPQLVADRLRATKRFEKVEVLKRFASIADPSQILLVIVVDEGPVAIKGGRGGAEARVVKARARLMFLPVLDYEEGYGLSYGVRLTVPDALGPKGRVSVPLTWGGERRAAVELDKTIEDGPLTRLQAGGGVSRREHPYFGVDDDRASIWGRAEKAFGGTLRAGTNASFDHVSFGGVADRMGRAGADVVFDTRLDPFLARNAVYARAAFDWLSFGNALPVRPPAQAGSDLHDAIRTELDLRGYAGLFGQTILVGRVLRQDSNHPLPPYLMPILGGTANLRGFPAGFAVGDTLVSTSAELRVPLTSPLSVGKLGVNAFVDAATVYLKGERLADQDLRKGLGGGVWFAAAFVRLNLVVAHGIGASTRVHLAANFSF